MGMIQKLWEMGPVMKLQMEMHVSRYCARYLVIKFCGHYIVLLIYCRPILESEKDMANPLSMIHDHRYANLEKFGTYLIL